ncbi:MAG: hypothetical protein QOG46_2560 [Pseudonocardiales bacterium]|jgi:hypothetical protein|nr:hypothetical protein [Pseudonocardiales bacterium]MDX6629013.1 hypothetical protein [Gaiellales bacterium]
MFQTASEIVIWMVLAALVGFATGWALRSVVANRARARLSERLEEKRRETQDLREELRHLRGDDEDVMRVPGPVPSWEGGDDDDESVEPESHEQPPVGATAEHDEVEHDEAEHDEVELGPLDEPEPTEDVGGGGTTRAMRLDEVEWEDVEESPRKRDDEA